MTFTIEILEALRSGTPVWVKNNSTGGWERVDKSNLNSTSLFRVCNNKWRLKEPEEVVITRFINVYSSDEVKVFKTKEEADKDREGKDNVVCRQIKEVMKI